MLLKIVYSNFFPIATLYLYIVGRELLLNWQVTNFHKPRALLKQVAAYTFTTEWNYTRRASETDAIWAARKIRKPAVPPPADDEPGGA